MMRMSIVITFGIAVAINFMSGCTKMTGTDVADKNGTKSETTNETPSASKDQSQGEGETTRLSKETIRDALALTYLAVKNLSYEKREKFLEWAQARADKLDDKVEALGERVDKLGDKARSKWDSQVKPAIKERQAKLKERLVAIKESSKSAWPELKEKFVDAANRLEEQVKQALEREIKDVDEKAEAEDIMNRN